MVVTALDIKLIQLNSKILFTQILFFINTNLFAENVFILSGEISTDFHKWCGIWLLAFDTKTKSPLPVSYILPGLAWCPTYRIVLQEGSGLR